MSARAENANYQTGTIISGPYLTIEDQQPLRGIRVHVVRCIWIENAESKIPRRMAAMGNNCAFALVAGGGFRGPPP